MRNQTKLMVGATLLLLILLIVKSLVLDPIGPQEGQALDYYNFVMEATQENNKGLLKPPIRTFRITNISHDPSGDDTIILKKGSQEEWSEVILEGKYEATIRVYFLHILPYKQFKVQGGVENEH
ncbi:hypothetical protein [Alkaliphilus serpentinus]|uniref:Uncharacterized protein n=1 Tax=Alkaliphilus serpentinus TaxID=1482731 RepID=A0A833M936_9FIRM|nr:hypothetical protein [Alkaliphilus serpentinus]KAB3532397.1 hypothetical protein F8153_02485 [Alkaliphilus serpentinus]